MENGNTAIGNGNGPHRANMAMEGKLGPTAKRARDTANNLRLTAELATGPWSQVSALWDTLTADQRALWMAWDKAETRARELEKA